MYFQVHVQDDVPTYESRWTRTSGPQHWTAAEAVFFLCWCCTAGVHLGRDMPSSSCARSRRKATIPTRRKPDAVLVGDGPVLSPAAPFEADSWAFMGLPAPTHRPGTPDPPRPPPPPPESDCPLHSPSPAVQRPDDMAGMLSCKQARLLLLPANKHCGPWTTSISPKAAALHLMASQGKARQGTVWYRPYGPPRAPYLVRVLCNVLVHRAF
jgi:hypothetical protein